MVKAAEGRWEMVDEHLVPLELEWALAPTGHRHEDDPILVCHWFDGATHWYGIEAGRDDMGVLDVYGLVVTATSRALRYFGIEELEARAVIDGDLVSAVELDRRWTPRRLSELVKAEQLTLV